MKNWKLIVATLLSLALLLSFVGGYAETEGTEEPESSSEFPSWVTEVYGISSIEDFYGAWTAYYYNNGRGWLSTLHLDDPYSFSLTILEDSYMETIDRRAYLAEDTSLSFDLETDTLLISDKNGEVLKKLGFEHHGDEGMFLINEDEDSEIKEVYFRKTDDTLDDVKEVVAEIAKDIASKGETGSAEPAASDDPAGAVHTDKETVKAVQQALNDAGFECGTPDGVAGKKTKKAITDYQTDKGLTVTGTVTDELLASLGIN